MRNLTGRGDGLPPGTTQSGPPPGSDSAPDFGRAEAGLEGGVSELRPDGVLVEVAVGGKEAGTVFEGDRRFDLVVRLPESLRMDTEVIGSLPIPLPAADEQTTVKTAGGNSPLAQLRYVPLSAVARIEVAPARTSASGMTA